MRVDRGVRIFRWDIWGHAYTHSLSSVCHYGTNHVALNPSTIPRRLFMKRVLTILGVILTVGCATYQRVESGGDLRNAALRAVGLEQVAWISKNTAAIPSGMDSVVDLKKMKAHVDNIAIKGSEGLVTTTY